MTHQKTGLSISQGYSSLFQCSPGDFSLSENFLICATLGDLSNPATVSPRVRVKDCSSAGTEEGAVGMLGRDHLGISASTVGEAERVCQPDSRAGSEVMNTLLDV